MSLTRDLVLDVANQVGGASPGVVTLHDWSRYGSDGAITTCTWQQLASTGLWVLDFNAATPDYVTIPAADSTQLDFTAGDFSIILSIYVDDLSAIRNLLQRGLGNADGWYCLLQANGQIQFYTNQAAALQVSSSAVGAITINNWYTIGFSRAGANVLIYQNGVVNTAFPGVHVDPLTCGRSLKIGIHDDTTQRPFDGRMALLAIYKYALSPAQHRAMYHKTRWLFGSPT